MRGASSTLRALALAASLVTIASAMSPRAGNGPITLGASAPEGCLAQGPRDPAAFPIGALRLGGTLFRNHTQNVTADTNTVFSIIALARASNESLNVTDAMNVTTETVEVCAFNVTRLLDSEDALAALATSLPTERLPPNATLLVTFHAFSKRTVWIEEKTALQALAFAATGGKPPRVADVVSFQNESRVERTFDRVVSYTTRDALVDLALHGAQAPGQARAQAVATTEIHDAAPSAARGAQPTRDVASRETSRDEENATSPEPSRVGGA